MPADPTGELYTALSFSRGFAPDASISPYAKLLPMLAGVGSPGTIQEVRPCLPQQPGLARLVSLMGRALHRSHTRVGLRRCPN